MDSHDEYQWKKLNDLLSHSFNNVKYDVRDVRSQMDKLRAIFQNFSSASIVTAFERQTKVIVELQAAMNHLNARVLELEKSPVKPEPHSLVLPQVAQIVATTKKAAKSAEQSIYDFPEGEVRITKVQFKSPKNGKRDLNGEWVEVTGYGGVDMTGFKLYDKGRKHTFKFPDGFKIYGPVKIMTGKGRNTNTRLYWGQPRPVWNDSGDVATLATKNNTVVSQVSSEPSFTFKILK